MKILIVALAAVIAAGGAGFYGWQQKRQLDRTMAELDLTRAALSRATRELAAARETLRELALELRLEQKPR
jgi:transposase-like protein